MPSFFIIIPIDSTYHIERYVAHCLHFLSSRIPQIFHFVPFVTHIFSIEMTVQNALVLKNVFYIYLCPGTPLTTQTMNQQKYTTLLLLLLPTTINHHQHHQNQKNWSTDSLPGFSRLRMHSKGTSTAAVTTTATTTVTATPTTISTPFNNINAAVNIINNNHSNNNAMANPNVPVAFVEFKDVASAAAAMCALQGKYLLSSDRGAMRIEFAKSKMAADVSSHHFYHLHMQQREVCSTLCSCSFLFGITWVVVIL